MFNGSTKDELRKRLLANRERSRPLPSDGSFSAAYFPWSVILNEATLKRALLYFDHIYLLAPESSKLDAFLDDLTNPNRPDWMRSPGLNTQLRHSISSFYSAIKPLRDADVIRTLDTNPLLANGESQRVIESLSLSDLLNYQASSIKTSMPIELAIIDRNLLHVREVRGEDIAFHYWDRAVVQSLHPQLLHKMDAFIKSLPSAVQPFVEQAIGNPSDAVTRALLLNSSLLSISEAGLTPLVDEMAYFDLLRIKYDSIFDARQNPNAPANVRTMQEFVSRAATKAGILANFVLQVALPNVDYAKIEDVIELREYFRGELTQFRASMIAFGARLKGTIADPEFVEEAERLVAAEIMPSLSELQRKLRLSKLKVLREFISSVMSLKPTVPFVIAAFTPVPLYAAALVAAGVVTLETAVRAHIEKQELLYNNGLAYLINLERSGLGRASLWSRSAAWLDRYGI